MLPLDLRAALRALARNPVHATVALVTLVLGIGANATVFSLVSGILLAPLPFPASHRLVDVREVSLTGGEMSAAWKTFVDWRERASAFELLVAHSAGGETTVLGAGEPLRIPAAGVSAGFLRALGVRPLRGRGFLDTDHRVGAEPVAIVSEPFWRTHLGSADLGDLRLTAAGFQLQVVGVMPAGFDHPRGVELWYPLELDEQNDSRTSHNYFVFGRLRTGSSIEQAQTELNAITRRFTDEPDGEAEARRFPDYFPGSATVRPLHEALIGDMRRPLLVLLAASLLVLLLACTNLASTTLARGAANQREFAVRHALGAGSARTVRTIVVETLVLAVVGTALGLALAALVLRIIPALAPAGLPRLDEVRIDGIVLAFAVGLAVLVSLLAGLLPAIRISTDAGALLRSGGRAGDAPGRRRMWNALIACEMATALLLLVGSGLLLRSFIAILDVRPGFGTTGVLFATVNPPSSKYAEPDRKQLYYDALLAALDETPGVGAVGLGSDPPLNWPSNGLIDIENGARPNVTVDYQLASGGYFDALGIPILRGRDFAPADGPDVEHVAIVNQRLARLAWPDADPIGQRLTGGGMDNFWDQQKWATVIGVVSDIRQRGLAADPAPAVFFHYRQRPFRAWSMTAAVRPQAGEASALAAAVRSAVRTVDADVPVRIMTVDERVARSLAPRRFLLILIGCFAALALALATVGVYGVVNYAVQRRRREIGIRVALGARPSIVRRQMQRDHLLASAIGAAAGLVVSLALTRYLAALLFAVRPLDPLTLFCVLAILAVVAWSASFIPALRASRTDPREMMRAD
jgi:predicted permease